jgi:hypothetical protein
MPARLFDLCLNLRRVLLASGMRRAHRNWESALKAAPERKLHQTSPFDFQPRVRLS